MHALEVLEYDVVLEHVARHAQTDMGAQRIRELAPSFDPDEVWAELERTRQAMEALAANPIPPLGGVRDHRQAAKRAGKGGVLGAVEIVEIGDALRSMRAAKNAVPPSDAWPTIYGLAQQLCDERRLEEKISDTFDGDGEFKDSASPRLASLRSQKKSASSRLIAKIQSYTTGKGRDHLSDPIYTVRDGRYVVPVKSEARGKIRGIVHDTSSSGQTVYIEPEDVLQLGNELREIEGAEREEQQRILIALSGQIGQIGERLAMGIAAAGTLDFLLAKARYGFEVGGCLPERFPGVGEIMLEGARHPLLGRETAVPLDIRLGAGENVLITGPNTGGKTVAIKTVGLFVLMLQSGLPIAAARATLAPFTQVWADIGDEQSLQQSLSTFSAHIKNIAEAMRKLRPGALVLFDEIGAGTDPAEGAALAKAILTDLVSRGATVLASTHYGELKAFAYNTEGFTNAAMEFDHRTFAPTYRLRMGAPGGSQALRIAERYGIPAHVVERAREGLGEDAQDVARMIERLEQAQRLARTAQSEADRRAADLKKAEQTAERKLREAEEIRRTAYAKAQETVEAVLREIRLEAEGLFEELKSAAGDQRKIESVRGRLKDLQSAGRELAAEMAPAPPRGGTAPDALGRGQRVHVQGYQHVGTLLEDAGGKKSVQVQIGPLKMTVATRLLTPAADVREPVRAKPNIGLQKAMTATTEIQLRELRAEQAIESLERFLDDAILAGVPSVRIVHGKGEGVLRKATQELLRRHPGIASYRDGEPTEGGQGVTIAVLR